jgi:prephenate dehydratase
LRTYKLYTQIDFIENEAGAVTRFVALRRTCAPASGHDRSAFAVRPQRDEPGSLVRFLQEFAFHGVNLTAIKSHPTREALGEYVFYIECEGHITQPRLRDVVTGILRLQPQTRFLGSFPEDKARPQQRDPHQGALLQNLDSTYLQMLGRVKSRA